jgi:hypothetical protein
MKIGCSHGLQLTRDDFMPTNFAFWPAVAGSGATAGIDPELPITNDRYEEAHIGFSIKFLRRVEVDR